MTFAQRIKIIQSHVKRATQRRSFIIAELAIVKLEVTDHEKRLKDLKMEAKRMWAAYGAYSEWTFLTEIVEGYVDELYYDLSDMEEAYRTLVDQLEHLEGSIESASYDMIDSIHY